MKRNGFTISEILVSTAIVIALGLCAMVSCNDMLDFSKKSVAKNDVAVIASAVNQYKFQMEALPSTLSDLTNASGSYGPWIDSDALIDPWGNNYIYVFNSANNSFAVYSKGKNQTGESSISSISGDDIGKIFGATLYGS